MVINKNNKFNIILIKMCNHNFKKGTKENISYCTICGTLSYKGIPSLSVASLTKTTISIDPLLLKYKPFQFQFDYSNYIKYYLTLRRKSINFIKMQANFFSIPDILVHKAMSYLDYIYLNNSVSFDLISNICIVCLLFAIQFNDCCSKSSLIDFKGFRNNIQNIQNLRELENYCLKCIDYNLGLYTSLDYINLFFSLGIVFPYKNIYKENYIDISFLFFNCICALEIIIEDNNCLDYSSYTIALSIIKMTLENFDCFDYEIFKKIYGINFNKERYIQCENSLKYILTNFYHNPLNTQYYLNQNLNNLLNSSSPSNSRDSTLDNSFNGNEVLGVI